MEEAVVGLVSLHGFPIDYVLDLDVLSFHRLCDTASTVYGRRMVEQAIAIRAGFGADKKEFEKYTESYLNQDPRHRKAKVDRGAEEFQKLLKGGGLR